MILFFHDKFAKMGDDALTVILIVAGLAIIGIALFSHSLWFKAFVAAYILLP